MHIIMFGGELLDVTELAKQSSNIFVYTGKPNVQEIQNLNNWIEVLTKDKEGDLRKLLKKSKNLAITIAFRKKDGGYTLLTNKREINEILEYLRRPIESE